MSARAQGSTTGAALRTEDRNVSSPRATDTAAALPLLTADLSFEEASRLVVDYLRDQVPLGYWAVTRYDGEDQVHLEAHSDLPELGPGLTVPWGDTLCSRMAAGRGPQVAPDAMAVPAYAESDAARELGVATYVGIPIQAPDQQLFGTLCGLDPAIQDEAFTRHEPLLHLLGSLLSMVLAADLARSQLAREGAQARTEATTDGLTGLLNRRGLDRFKELNDRDGHAAGDAHLVRTAQVLRGGLRAHDGLARIGGDEFAVLVTGLTTSETEALVARLRADLVAAGIGASIGHARFHHEGDFAATFAAADAAMYAEKRRRAG